MFEDKHIEIPGYHPPSPQQVAMAIGLFILAIVAMYLFDGFSHGVAGLFWLAVFGALYLLPTIIAHKRRHRQRVAIMVINIFLGWTFFGWVASLAWAFTSDCDPAPLQAGDGSPGR